MSNVEPRMINLEFLAKINQFRDELTYKPITANDEVVDHRICVAVRKRPLNERGIRERCRCHHNT